ncbi:unnamed protein product [Calicophoron daubneyi]|uniref:snRNA-activating protein complex subunit 1 n=1 Tax=Calicophoron daubneyi TaxID=300641 RepID=A0AAV2TBK3_CALDB
MGCSQEPYVFCTSFHPIRGVDEDLKEFINKFEKRASVRFTEFCGLWKKEKFIHIIYGRQSQHGLYDILGCIFHRLVEIIQPKKEQSQLARICALYLLYAFYGRQPLRHHVHIRVCPESWRGLQQLAIEARDQRHLDVYYIFKQLCATNAFHFCATRQQLYPGVPLFDSPQIPANELVDERTLLEPGTYEPSSSKDRHRTMSAYTGFLCRQNAPFPELKDNLTCLEMSVERYVEAKRSITDPLNESRTDHPEVSASSSEQDLDMREEFLPGLNFITYPDSLKKIKEIAAQLHAENNMDRGRKELSEDESGSEEFESTPSEAEVESPTPPKRRRRRRKIGARPPSQLTSESDTRAQTGERDSEELSDLGDRRRTLRQPITWAAELEEQAKGIRACGVHLNRRRPTTRKILKKRKSLCPPEFEKPTS